MLRLQPTEQADDRLSHRNLFSMSSAISCGRNGDERRKEGTACKLLKSLRLARRRLSTFQHLPKCRQCIRSRPRGLNSVRVSIRYSFTTGVSFRWGNGFLRVKTHYRCKMSVAQPVKIPALNCRSAIWKSDAENERTLSGGQLGFAILGLMLTLLPNR